MLALSRFAFIIIPKDSCLRRAASIDDLAPEHVEAFGDQALVFLAPESETGEETPPIEDYYQEMFESVLEGWCRDPQLWPKNRNLQMLLKWFKVYRQSVILDLAEGEFPAGEY